MTTVIFPLFSLLLFLVVSINADEPGCVENDAVRTCYDEVQNLARASKSPQEIVADGRTLEDVCSKLTEARNCIKPYENCAGIYKEIRNLKWETTRGVMNYVCDKAYYAFERNNACWKSAIAGTAVNNCDQEELRASQSTNEQICNLHNKAVTCYVNAVKKNCMEEAAEVMTAFQVYKRKPVTTPINCTLEADDGTYSGSSKITYPCLTILTLVSASLLSMSSWITERF